MDNHGASAVDYTTNYYCCSVNSMIKMLTTIQN